MAIEINKTSSKIYHENAYTNNTFDLSSMHRTVKNTMENSFNYLMRVQKSYLGIYRFNFSEKDVYTDPDGKICISVDKDFIDGRARKEYRHSQYYNKFIDQKSIRENPNLFWFTPIVMIDDKVLFSYDVKATLDGHTEIGFNHIRHLHEFLAEPHFITVVFYENASLQSFTTNIHVVEKYNMVLPASVTGLKGSYNRSVFLFVRGTEKSYGSNYILAYMMKDGTLKLDGEDPVLYSMLHDNPSVEITVLAIDWMYAYTGKCEIKNRIDNNRQSSVFCLVDELGHRYSMPIHTQNIIIFKRRISDGELLYENNKEVILHYPNIYEIMSDDVDASEYDYVVFYLYRADLQAYLKYPDFLKHIYGYFMLKLDKGYEESIRTLLYEGCDDEAVSALFFEYFDYQDPDYIYSNSDFANSVYPYDFDYKIGKLEEFIAKNPYILEEYAKGTDLPYSMYFLDVRNIDLSSRIRRDTTQESTLIADYIDFKEDCYVFRFVNTTYNDLHLRFFIDGLFCNEFYKIRVRDMEYIYIPTRLIRDDSRIDVERFEEYLYKKTVNFESMHVAINLDFPHEADINPTLYDLFITDENGNKMDRSQFRMYARINLEDYNISDDYGVDDDSLSLIIGDEDIIIDDDGTVYLCVEDMFILDGEDDPVGDLIFGDDDIVQRSYSDDRLPLKYMHLDKIKIYANNSAYLNRDLQVNITKLPFLVNHKSNKTGLIKVPLFNGQLLWKEDPSYVRIFVNRRLNNIDYDIISDDPAHTYISPRAFLDRGDILSVDITPYSYEQEYGLEIIPENFRIELSAALSKPFDLAYYDAYLNGRRLNETNIEMITPNIIQLYNVSSRLNFLIYRKDRDVEFAGFQSVINTPLDILLTNENLEEQYKKEIVHDILTETIDPEYIIDGTNTEPDIADDVNEMPVDLFEMYRFFLDTVNKNPVVRPTALFIDKELVINHYNTVYNDYSNLNDRIVIKPSLNAATAAGALVFGRVHMDVDVSETEEDRKVLESSVEALQNIEVLESLPYDTLFDAVKDIYSRFQSLLFDTSTKDKGLRVIVTDETNLGGNE